MKDGEGGAQLGDLFLEFLLGSTREERIERIEAEKSRKEKIFLESLSPRAVYPENSTQRKEDTDMALTASEQAKFDRISKIAPAKRTKQQKADFAKLSKKAKGEKTFTSTKGEGSSKAGEGEGGRSLIDKAENTNSSVTEFVNTDEVALESLDIPNAISASRTTYPYATTPTVTFPQSVDLFHYGYSMYPAGDATGSDSIARDHFQSVIGPKMIAAIRRSLSYGPAAAITIDEIADYINEVATAYYHLVSIKKHMNLCFYARNKPSLNLRFNDIYDETIAPAHTRLANALSAMYLPRNVKLFIDKFTDIYATDRTPFTALFQFTPYVGGVNNAVSFVTIYNAQVTAVQGVTKRIDMNTAFSHPNFSDEFINMEPLSLEAHRNPDLFLDAPPRVMLNDELLDMWMNAPLEASDAVPAVKRFEAASNTATINRISVGSRYTQLSNVMCGKFITGGRYEPGILVPAEDTTPANVNNFRLIGSTGNDDEVSITSFNALIRGVIARMAENTYDTTNTTAIRPAGTTYLSTTMNHIASDTYDIMDMMFS